MKYEDYVDLKYKPDKNDLICDFFVEPSGISLKKAAGGVAAVVPGHGGQVRANGQAAMPPSKPGTFRRPGAMPPLIPILPVMIASIWAQRTYCSPEAARPRQP